MNQPKLTTNNNPKIDPNCAYHLGDRIWWVGHYLEGDPFQCHAYIIENGHNSVLIDPGGLLTIESVKSKIEQVIPLSKIRYIICQHQDPDITAALPTLLPLIGRSDIEVYSHWRTNALLKHYNLPTTLNCVEALDWNLDIGGRILEFVFTPYAHFPGAFCTFDKKSRILFSSDLFGGYTQGFSLFAQDEGIFEFIRPFHEHYIPSQEVLKHAMERIREKRPGMIAPQHGSIIKEHLIEFVINKLSGLDCGLFLLSSHSTAVHRLSHLNKMLRDLTNLVILYRDFREIALKLEINISNLLGHGSLSFIARNPQGKAVYLGSEYRFHPHEIPLSGFFSRLLSHSSSISQVAKSDFQIIESAQFADMKIWRHTERLEHVLTIPLESESQTFQGAALFRLSDNNWYPPNDLNTIATQLKPLLSAALEREVIMQSLESEKEHLLEQLNHDPLTGLFNRHYLNEMVSRLFNLQDRGEPISIGFLFCDIDHFKSINDNYGHNTGDKVLQKVAATLKQTVRGTDFPVRLGGEEFGVMIFGDTVSQRNKFAERLRLKIEQLSLSELTNDLTITISIGVAKRKTNESFKSLLERADQALYRAKIDGRNRVEMAND